MAFYWMLQKFFSSRRCKLRGDCSLSYISLIFMNDKSLCLFNPFAAMNATKTVCAGLIASLRE